MLVRELDMNLALEVREEEGFERGMEMGLERGREEGVERGVEMGLEKGKAETAIEMLKKGFEVAVIAEILKMPVEWVEGLLWKA